MGDSQGVSLITSVSGIDKKKKRVKIAGVDLIKITITVLKCSLKTKKE